MSRHVTEHLSEYALGILDGSEHEIRAHLRECSRCSAELEDLQACVEYLGFVAPAEQVSDSVRERLLTSASAGRFAMFVDTVAQWIEVVREKAAELLSRIDDGSAWSPGPSETSALMHLPAGPALAEVNVGFVRVREGARFPWHRHLGKERVLVLQGSCRDSDGSLRSPGDVVEMAANTEHDFTALPGEDFIYLVVLETGVEFDVPFEL